jgi:hypothetical protein
MKRPERCAWRDCDEPVHAWLVYGEMTIDGKDADPEPVPDCREHRNEVARWFYVRGALREPAEAAAAARAEIGRASSPEVTPPLSA